MFSDMKLLMSFLIALAFVLALVESKAEPSPFFFGGREGGREGGSWYRPAREGGWYRPAREGGWYRPVYYSTYYGGSSEEYGK